jgi:hypothetical protein
MHQELAVGSLRPADASDALTALFRSLEGATPEEARARGLKAFPRAAEALSRLYHLETLELTPKPGGVTAVRLGIRMRPDTLRPTAPRYAAFLEKVAAPMKTRARLYDTSGAAWWRVELDELLWTFSFHVRDGSLVPLEGPRERRLPDSVQLAVDFSTKLGPFTVGVRNLVADVTLTRADEEKGYTARYSREPEWRLPFFIKPLLGGPLSYPFEGPGSSSSFALRMPVNGPTELARSYDMRVRESWILKWMGGLGGSTMGDFRKGAESESDRYSRECLYALRDDVVTLLNEPGGHREGSGSHIPPPSASGASRTSSRFGLRPPWQLEADAHADRSLQARGEARAARSLSDLAGARRHDGEGLQGHGRPLVRPGGVAHEASQGRSGHHRHRHGLGTGAEGPGRGAARRARVDGIPDPGQPQNDGPDQRALPRVSLLANVELDAGGRRQRNGNLGVCKGTLAGQGETQAVALPAGEVSLHCRAVHRHPHAGPGG